MSEIFSDSDLNDNQNIEDIDSCLGYLKKREVFLYKMMNDPDHKAMLYFLEVLMNSERSSVPIDELSGKFYCKNFTQDMRDACGNNASGLKKFLERYPSLFAVNGNCVSAVSVELSQQSNNHSVAISNCSSPSVRTKSSHQSNSDSENNNNSNSTSSNLSNPSRLKGPVKFDISKETEAVRFFQNKLLKRDEKWVPIKSLAGHLSQANSDIREVVGPQLDFRKFIVRNPNIFEVQGELVSLKDHGTQFSLSSSSGNNINSSCTSNNNNNTFSNGTRRPKLFKDSIHINGFDQGLKSMTNRPKSLNVSGNNSFLSFNRENGIIGSAISAPTTPVAHSANSHHVGLHLFSRSSPLSMTSNEYRAVMFLRKVIEKKNNLMSLSNLFICLGRCRESIRNVIGWTKFELQEFIRKNSVFFDLTPNEMVINRKADKVNVIITGASSSSESGTRTLTNRTGIVFHVAKLWGIIDLGRHEHVFFDKSIFKHLDDLQRHFKVGETLYFNAILAPKESRAKWRATQVWKECDREMVEKFCGRFLSKKTTANGGDNVGVNSDGLSDIASILTETSEELECCLGFLPHNNGCNNDKDTKLLPQEVEDELTRILELTRSSSSSLNEDDDEDDPSLLANNVVKAVNQSLSSIPSPDISSHQSIQSDPSVHSHPLSAPAGSSYYFSNHSYKIQSANDLGSAAKALPNGLAKKTTPVNSLNSSSSNDNANIHKKKKMLNVSTQTLSTGDIMATNLFHE